MIRGNGGWLRAVFVDRNNQPADVDPGTDVVFTVLAPGGELLSTLRLSENQVQRVDLGTYEAAYVGPEGVPYFDYFATGVINGVPQMNGASEAVVRRSS